ncbi:helix-turn-helix domain-containing protein [Oerskovia sp. M15]
MSTTNAAQERAHAKVEYNAFLAACPSRQLLDRISDKWVVLVLCALGATPRPTRCGGCCEGDALLRDLASARGASQKMLTQTLRSLERDGVLTRTVTPTVPVTVSYELTDLGLSPRHDTRPQVLGPEQHGRGAHAPRGPRRSRLVINASDGQMPPDPRSR